MQVLDYNCFELFFCVSDIRFLLVRIVPNNRCLVHTTLGFRHLLGSGHEDLFLQLHCFGFVLQVDASFEVSLFTIQSDSLCAELYYGCWACNCNLASRYISVEYFMERIVFRKAIINCLEEQYIHSYHCLLEISFYHYMSKPFPIFVK